MIKYYILAIELNDFESMKNLAIYYYNIKDYKQMMKYFLMAIELDNLKAINLFEIFYKSNKLLIYNYLIKNNTNEFINNKIIELKNEKIINNYENKIKLYTKLNLIEECCVCLITKLNVTFECAHYVCTDCYVEIDKCPICRQIIDIF
jgi:tetratricopeptide (TPR) repeat protein